MRRPLCAPHFLLTKKKLGHHVALRELLVVVAVGEFFVSYLAGMVLHQSVWNLLDLFGINLLAF